MANKYKSRMIKLLLHETTCSKSDYVCSVLIYMRKCEYIPIIIDIITCCSCHALNYQYIMYILLVNTVNEERESTCKTVKHRKYPL